MALPKNYSIWLAVDYNCIEKAFWNKPKRCEKHREWWVIEWFFRMEASRNSSEESYLGVMSQSNSKENSYGNRKIK